MKTWEAALKLNHIYSGLFLMISACSSAVPRSDAPGSRSLAAEPGFTTPLVEGKILDLPPNSSFLDYDVHVEFTQYADRGLMSFDIPVDENGSYAIPSKTLDLKDDLIVRLAIVNKKSHEMLPFSLVNLYPNLVGATALMPIQFKQISSKQCPQGFNQENQSPPDCMADRNI